jgi:S1-C subfamily serine protease
MYKSKILISAIVVSLFFGGSAVNAGLQGTLDTELTSLIKKTEPYLVTVKGDGEWRNLIATGIVYNEEGYVITSSQTYKASQFEVSFAGGETYKAEPVGVDKETGLALLKIKGKTKFQVPQWGSTSSLKAGDWVLFVGNSYDQPSSVNIGTYRGMDDEGFLELSMNVGPGSSGGAVLNTDGEVVGVLIALEFSKNPMALLKHGMNFGDYYVLGRSERSDETALAIPIDQTDAIVKQLVDYGKVKRGFLGISQKNLTEQEKKDHNIDGGVLIVDVVDDSPAEEAGLREDDIITEINDKKIDETSDLYYEVRSRKPGDKITIAYIRDNEKSKVDVELAESRQDYFLGSLDLQNFMPKLKVNNKLDLPLTDGLEEQMKLLEDELDKLRLEFEELKTDLKK